MTFRDAIKRLIVGPEPQPVPNLGRNERCWCGSGRKYKMCHMATDDRKRVATRSGTVSAPPTRGF
jgi:hypothetical protein